MQWTEPAGKLLVVREPARAGSATDRHYVIPLMYPRWKLILWRLRRRLGLYDHRFSDDLRWVMAIAHRYAVASGSPSVTTAHVLAAIATHPKGQSLLGDKTANIQNEASGGQAETPTPIPAKGRLPLHRDVKSLVQESLKVMPAAGWKRVEVENFYSVLIGLQNPSAAPVLQKFGIVPPGGPAAG